MLTETYGNLWDFVSTHKIIITTNVLGVMGAGIAKQARDKYPGLEDDYKKMIKISNSLGTRCATKPYAPDAFPDVVLVPTKYDWRNPSDLGLITRNLIDLSKWLGGPYAIPELGCGLGKLVWEQVAPAYNVLIDAPADWVIVHPLKRYTGILR